MPTNFPSRVLSVDMSRMRLTLSKDLTDHLKWALSDPDTLVCQWIALGHIRLFRQSDARVQGLWTEAKEAAASETELEVRVRRQQTIEDVFRTVQVHPGDKGRLALGREVLSAFAGPDSAPTELFQQVGDDWIDVMTMEHRQERLAQWAKDRAP